MKQKTKLILTWIFIIGLIASIIIFSQVNNLFVTTGVSTLALSQANLQSSNSYLNGKAWVLTFSAGGLGQSYYGTITPSDVDDKTSDSTKTTKNLNIKVDFEDEQCLYPIQSAGTLKPIYDITYQTYTEIPLIASCDKTTASSKLNIPYANILYAERPSGSLSCYVVYTTGQSVVGNFGQTLTNQRYTITLNVDGNVATKTIETLTGSGQGAIGDYAYAVWNGNLNSGVSCPQTTDTLYRTAYVNGNWRLISKQAYDQYVTKYNTNPNIGFLQPNAVLQWVQDLQSYSSQAKIAQGFGSISNPTSMSDAVLKYTTPSSVSFPVTTLYVKADTLGIFTPVPDIRIDSTSSECFKTGDEGLIAVKLKNYGSQGGTFRTYAQCQGSFTPTQSISGSLQPDESRSVNIPLSASATQKTTSTCIVYVETTAGTKYKSTGVCVDPQITCTIPYPTKFCAFQGSLEVVKQCSQDGVTSNLIETCGANEHCDAGECKEESSGGGNNNDGSCGLNPVCIWNKIMGYLTIIKWFILVIVSLLSLFFSHNLISMFLGTKKPYNIIGWILAGLVGAMVGVGIYAILLTEIFWWIIVGTILTQIILFFVPFKRLFGR